MEKVKTRRNPVKMDWTWRYWWEHMVSNIYRNRDVNGGRAGRVGRYTLYMYSLALSTEKGL